VVSVTNKDSSLRHREHRRKHRDSSNQAFALRQAGSLQRCSIIRFAKSGA
jgi:hypothetical protein